MAEEYYKIPENPQYSVDDIRKLQNSDPVNAQTIVNPLILRLLENIAALKKITEDIDGKSVPIVISDTPPTSGPALWFCSDPTWRPEPQLVAVAELGDPAEADNADVLAEVNNVNYPVTNATVSKEGDDIIATFDQQ